jgi:short-subunit dehydrogenase
MLSKERYGPWALIVGGSEGIGEHLARKLGAAGINVVLVARKPGPLAETSEKVREESGVDVRTLELDIARPDMLERIREVTDGLDIGLLVHNVGGGGGSGLFVNLPVEKALTPVLANAVAATKLVNHFGKPMADRGRGGILFFGSMAGNAGSYFLVGYSAAKAWIQTFAEGLWAELQPLGVDVLVIPIGATDTPARRRSGTVDAEEMKVARPEDVAQQALDQLPHGPVYVAPENVEYFNSLYGMSRREAAELQRDLLTRMLRDAKR